MQHSASSLSVPYMQVTEHSPFLLLQSTLRNAIPFLKNIKLQNRGLKDTVLALKCITLNMTANTHFGGINFPCDANHFILQFFSLFITLSHDIAKLTTQLWLIVTSKSWTNLLNSTELDICSCQIPWTLSHSVILPTNDAFELSSLTSS